MHLLEQEQEEQNTIQKMEVVFVGPQGAGKTSLVQRLVLGEQLGSMPTVGTCVYSCDGLPGAKLYDTPGDERYSWSYDGIAKRADAIVYCVCEGMHVRDYGAVNPGATIIKVHTKADTRPDRPERAPGELETSARTGEGCRELLEMLSAVPVREEQKEPDTPKPAKKKTPCSLF